MKIAPILICIGGAVVLGHVLTAILPESAPLWLVLIAAFVLAAPIGLLCELAERRKQKPPKQEKGDG